MLDNDGTPVTDADLRKILGDDVWDELSDENPVETLGNLEELRELAFARAAFICDTLDRTAPPYWRYVYTSPSDPDTGYSLMLDLSGPEDYDDEGNPVRSAASAEAKLEVTLLDAAGFSRAAILFQNDQLLSTGDLRALTFVPTYDVSDTSMDLLEVSAGLSDFSRANDESSKVAAAQKTLHAAGQHLDHTRRELISYRTGDFEHEGIDYRYESTYDCEETGDLAALDEQLHITNPALSVGFQVCRDDDGEIMLIAYSLDEDGDFTSPGRHGSDLSRKDYADLAASLEKYAEYLAHEYFYEGDEN